METISINNADTVTLMALHKVIEPICPVCGASRLTLRASLAQQPTVREVEYPGVGGCIIRRREHVSTPNHQIAMMMLDNCPECRKALSR